MSNPINPTTTSLSSDSVINDTEPSSDSIQFLESVAQILGLTGRGISKRSLSNFRNRLWRFSAYIRQPLKNDGTCNQTPFSPRWNNDPIKSHLTASDPRYAIPEECSKVFNTLLALLIETSEIESIPSSIITAAEHILQRPICQGSLICVHTGQPITASDIQKAMNYSTDGLGAYAVPVSYRTGLDIGGYHTSANVGWMKPLHINYILREELNKAFPSHKKAVNTVLSKIQVKSYCTDKVTMPPFYSNRDIRWATWPTSPQYASYYDCSLIELELMAQLFEFVGAPALDKALANQVASIRGKPIIPGGRKCFVTGYDLKFADYIQAAINPKGGKSEYHVGHILPLTTGGRHVCRNVAWQSDAGNRIQGNDTLERIEEILVHSVEYHIRRDMQMAEQPAGLNEKIERLWRLLNDIREHQGKPKVRW